MMLWLKTVWLRASQSGMLSLIILSSLSSQPLTAAENSGFYRFPDLYNDTVLFTAEGDLWTVPVTGGKASRLTSNHGFESHGRISPDGQTVAFLANYDGPRELYVMPLSGGTPKRLTYTNSARMKLAGWTADQRILFSSSHESSLVANTRLFIIHPDTREVEKVPLNQAYDGVFNQLNQLYFTRLIGSSDNTRHYLGGTAKNLWQYKPGQEATPLTADYPGTSTAPAVWKNRVYFASDRSGTMNIWSMNFAGKDLKQHSFFKDREIRSPALHQGQMVFQVDADLYRLDLDTGTSQKIAITLNSDLDQKRPHWVEKPIQYLTDTSLSPDNGALLLTARGHIVASPVEQGRVVKLPVPETGLFFARAQYIPASGKVLALARKEAEISLWLLSANGENDGSKLLDLNKSLSSEIFLSPDGTKLAWRDSDFTLWLHNLETGETTEISQGKITQLTKVSWSPDNRWLAYTEKNRNLNTQIYLYSLDTGESQPLTSNRYSSTSPVWSLDGQWLLFISSRFYGSKVPGPDGYAQPEPYSEENDGIFALAMNSEAEWPFQELNELSGHEKLKGEPEKLVEGTGEFIVKIDTKNISRRLYQVPLTPGRFSDLAIVGDYLYWLEPDEETFTLKALKLTRDEPSPVTITSRINYYEPSFDLEGIFYQQNNQFYLLEAGADESKAKQASLEHWRIQVDPAAEWRQIIYDSWLAYRDYFVDKTMNDKDWGAILNNHLPLAERITDRNELDAVLGSMLGQLGVLHAYTFPGDERNNGNLAFEGALGAEFTKEKDGFRIQKILQPDPEKPYWQSPLAQPGLVVQENDLLTHINHQPLTSVATPEELLTWQADTQTLLTFQRNDTKETYQEVVKPLTPCESDQLRYRSWVNNNRLRIDQLGQEQIGYVHLSALTDRNFAEWVQQYYAIHNRKGLILDIRYNGGGNISSWILSRLMRKAYSYGSARGVSESWNMPYAFRGPIVLLVNEHTSSDAEELMDGFRQLKLGTIIGTRTWGGRIYKFDVNMLDNGALSLPASTHALPDNTWPSENQGIEPDIQIDNLPHASFRGDDAQLTKAIQTLQEKIRQTPVPEPVIPQGPIAPIRTGRSQTAYPSAGQIDHDQSEAPPQPSAITHKQ